MVDSERRMNEATVTNMGESTSQIMMQIEEKDEIVYLKKQENVTKRKR